MRQNPYKNPAWDNYSSCHLLSIILVLYSVEFSRSSHVLLYQSFLSLSLHNVQWYYLYQDSIQQWLSYIAISTFFLIILAISLHLISIAMLNELL